MPPYGGGGGGGGGGGVRLSGGPTLLDVDNSVLESDASSIITISDTLNVSDTEEEMERTSGAGGGLIDRQKYRMPDIGKTRLNLRTKEPLSPTPRYTRSHQHQTSSHAPSSQQQLHQHHHSPETPRTWHTANEASPATPQTAASSNAHEGASDAESVFIPTLSRSNSVYTLGRASLQDQLSQLTTMKLPDASSLARRIAEIPTSTDAAKALSDAAEQIRVWISKASDVLNGLNAEDDVEWAAAGGREGIEDVDKSIGRFGGLVDVYLVSIDQLQTRSDVASLAPDELMASVRQMETIVSSWKAVRTTLDGVKTQVELAMEWEELWNRDLGEVGQEMENLNRLVFEMEERRHQGAGCVLTSKDSIDLGDLETIIEERPGKTALGGNVNNNNGLAEPFGAALMTPRSLLDSPSQEHDKDDSSLLALFARMQPLRASLDFLPMKLSVFHIRANAIFPSACQDLDLRRTMLESQWEKLEADAEFLRRELGEDRWILVFRNAGRQALKMCESITRSYTKLKEGVDAEEHLTSITSFMRKVENYAAKKTHYGPAIGRVLAIIDRGVQDRLTVNGEILRLQSDMRERWTTLRTAMDELDSQLEEISLEARDDKQLRDSVSTVLSSERSVASSLIDTPGSSPASSVVSESSRRGSYQGSRTPTPLSNAKTRPASHPAQGSNRLSLSSSIPRRISLAHQSPSQHHRSASPSPLAPRASSSRLPLHLAAITPSAIPKRLEAPPPSRPRWSRSTVIETKYFAPLSATEPSPYAKTHVERRTNFLRSTRAVSSPLTMSTNGSSETTTPITTQSNRQSSLSSSKTTSTQPRTPASATTPSFRLSRASIAGSLPPSASSPASSTTTNPSSHRKSLLPIPSSATTSPTSPATSSASPYSSSTSAATSQTQNTQYRSTARTPLRQRASRPSLRTPSSSSTATNKTRRSSVAPPPLPTSLVNMRNGEATDGNEADCESGILAGRVRRGYSSGGGGMKISLKEERPPWRP